MIGCSSIYRDETHTYRRIGATITMIPIGGGTPCAMIYDSEAIARDRLGWLVRVGHMQKAPRQRCNAEGAGENEQHQYSTRGRITQCGEPRKKLPSQRSLRSF